MNTALNLRVNHGKSSIFRHSKISWVKGCQQKTARQESIRTSGVEFELAYSDDWVDVFDKRARAGATVDSS